MIILVSSKALGRTLDQIPAGEYVKRVDMEEGCIIFVSDKKSIRMLVKIIEFEPSLEQNWISWNQVHILMKQVNEQPVVIEIHGGIVNVTFQY